MGKKRVFTKMVKKDAPRQPAVRIPFKGKFQVDYFTLIKAAEERGETQTGLARLIISDWLKLWRDRKGDPSARQMELPFKDKKKKSKGDK
jgi:hypothetical protein